MFNEFCRLLPAEMKIPVLFLSSSKSDICRKLALKLGATGLLRPDAGQVWVEGFDVWTNPVAAKARIHLRITTKL